MGKVIAHLCAVQWSAELTVQSLGCFCPVALCLTCYSESHPAMTFKTAYTVEALLFPTEDESSVDYDDLGPTGTVLGRKYRVTLPLGVWFSPTVIKRLRVPSCPV